MNKITKIALGLIILITIMVSAIMVSVVFQTLQPITSKSTTTKPTETPIIPTPFPNPQANAYVEVDYTTIGWFISASASLNNAYLVLNVTIINKGYAEVYVQSQFQQVGAVGPAITSLFEVSLPLLGVPIEGYPVPEAYNYKTNLPTTTLYNNQEINAIIVFGFGATHLATAQYFQLKYTVQCDSYQPALVQVNQQ
jgi:cobalamin biosynthesis Co2+ chelatase CbiK